MRRGTSLLRYAYVYERSTYYFVLPTFPRFFDWIFTKYFEERNLEVRALLMKSILYVSFCILRKIMGDSPNPKEPKLQKRTEE